MPIDDTSLENLWNELHDLERRTHRLEDDLIDRTTAARIERAHQAARLRRQADGRGRFRFLVETLIAALSLAALVLSLHLF